MKHTTATLLGFSLPALLLVSALGANAAAPDARPNILFILSDDHAAHALSCYGSKINQTPNLDRIATNGMRFTRCFVNNSICTPSRAAILTGKYSHKNGVTVFNRFDGKQPHVAKYLRAAGYQTALVGKWHLFSEPTGFDYWNILPGQGLYNDPVMIENGRTNKWKGYVSDLIGDFSLYWLKQRDPNKPFCLMMQPKAPHREWTPPPKYTNLYAGIDLPLPPTFHDNYASRSRAATEATMRMEHLRKTDLKTPLPAGLSEQEEKHWRYQRYIKDYLRCIASMDENVGRVLDYLESSGLATNTLVIYTSDQGFFLGDHGWFDKRFMYEESLRMPLLVSLPGRIKPGTVNDAMAMNIDFAPTLLELAGVRVPKDMQGRSLAPLLRGETPKDWRISMYYRYYHYPGDHQVQPHYGVRTDRHKLIYFNAINEWELYDLEKDRHETNNVFADPAYGVTVAKLRTELARLRVELDDRDQFANELSNGEVFHPVPLELALRYNFNAVAGDRVKDASGQGRDGQLRESEVTTGRRGQALKLSGHGDVTVPAMSGDLDPSAKTFTVGAWCQPENLEGMVISHGGESQGYALYVLDGLPQFAMRSAGALTVVRAKEKVEPGQWIHLAAVFNARSEATLYVNAKAVGHMRCAPIQKKPASVFAVGADPDSRVGDYDSALGWTGLLEDVRVYRGELDQDALEAWAGQ